MTTLNVVITDIFEVLPRITS